MGMRDFWEGDRNITTESSWWLHSSVHLLRITELHTSNRWKTVLFRLGCTQFFRILFREQGWRAESLVLFVKMLGRKMPQALLSKTADVIKFAPWPFVLVLCFLFKIFTSRTRANWDLQVGEAIKMITREFCFVAMLHSRPSPDGTVSAASLWAWPNLHQRTRLGRTFQLLRKLWGERQPLSLT